MKKIIVLLLLFTFTVNLNGSVAVVSHHTFEIPIDNSLHDSLTRKDYHFQCRKCKKEFVISNMLYHENTDMYFYYKRRNGLKVLQPFDGKNMCENCFNKCFLTVLERFLCIILLIILTQVCFNK